jgi:hypothetical protein
MTRRQLTIIRKATLVVALFSLTFSSSAQTVELADVWSLFRIADQPVGYLHETVRRSGGGRTITAIDAVIVINRLGSKVEVIQKSEIEEAADGSALRIRGETSSSKQTTLIDATVKEGALEIQTSTGGKSYTRTLPFSGRLVGVEGARKLSAANLNQPGDQISYQMFVPEIAAVITIARKVLGRETLQLTGSTFDAVKAEERMEGFPIQRTVWLDRDGRVIKQVEPGPFGLSELARSTRHLALAAAGGGSLPEEMYARSLVRANVRLPQPRSVEQVKMRLIHKAPTFGWPTLTGEHQRVLSQDHTTTVLEVSRPQLNFRHAIRPTASDDGHYLRPNAVLQSDDPEVERIAREVVGAEPDRFKAAKKLQAWVGKNLKLDLSIAVAPASEVVRNRAGTCVAYAVLLASLERAAGIPSRVAMGFAYASGIWGGHAWTEIRIGDEWIPVDAILYAPGVADAARFKFMTSTLESGSGTDLYALQQLFGNVDISILEYTVNGRRVVVPEDSKPFSLDGNMYSNPWLGFSIEKPDGFQFSKLDAVWPDATVVGMDGPGGEKIRLLQKGIVAGERALIPEAYLEEMKLTGTRTKKRVGNRSAAAINAPQKSGLALIDGTTVWILTVEGNNAPRLLEKVAATWQR